MRNVDMQDVTKCLGAPFATKSFACIKDFWQLYCQDSKLKMSESTDWFYVQVTNFAKLFSKLISLSIIP